MTLEKKGAIDIVDSLVTIIIVCLLIYSTFLLVNAYSSGAHIGEWIWNRHQNLFSWYSRPLFIIPACYYAYKRKIGFIIAMLILLGTSLFWFAPPTEVSETVSDFLDWERQLFFNPEFRLPLITLSIAVILFLFGLFYALWHRNFWAGLVVFNIGNLLKIAVSVIFGGDVGMAAIVPTLSSMAILNLIAIGFWKWKKRKSMEQ